MSFATTADTNYEGNSLPVLPPGIYDNMSLIGGKFEQQLTKDDGTPLEDRITINFKTQEGAPLAISELRPKDAEKEDKMVKRIGHILSKFYDKSQLVQSNATFEAYANWAVMMINNSVAKKQLVKIMVVGSVYEGKARTRVQGYPPFIVKAGEDLFFDSNALKSNAEYAAFQNPTPDSSTSGTPNAKTVGEF